MATKSVQVNNLDQEPRNVLQTGVQGGRVRVAQFELNLEGEASGTVFTLADLPVNATVLEINLFQTASSTTTFDIGDSNDQDRIIDGQAINQELVVKAGRNNTTGTNGLAAEDFLKQLWEVLGYASRVAAGRSIRLSAKANAQVGTGKIFGAIYYVVD